MESELRLLLSEREWSWSLVGAGYLGVTILIRQWIFQSVIRETKAIDAAVYSAVRALYLRKSGPGWALFFISFLLVVTFWVASGAGRTDFKLVFLLSCALLFFYLMSIVLHLKAFLKALLAVLRQKIGVDREF